MLLPYCSAGYVGNKMFCLSCILPLFCFGVGSDVVGATNRGHVNLTVYMWGRPKREERERKWLFTNGLIDFPSEGLGEFLDDKNKDKEGGRGAANIVSCQTGALHQVTGAGGTTVTWRMTTDEGERWWEPCPVWRAFLLSCLLSSSVPHSIPPPPPAHQQQVLCLPAASAQQFLQRFS